MSGGLRHQSDEKKRPSYLVGYKLADKASHPVKGTQCSCAEASSVLELMKFITPNTLTGADVLRDVEIRRLRSSYERGCQAKTLLPLSVRPRSVLASRPLFFVERILVLTPGAPQSMTGIRIVVAGLP